MLGKQLSDKILGSIPSTTKQNDIDNKSPRCFHPKELRDQYWMCSEPPYLCFVSPKGYRLLQKLSLYALCVPVLCAEGCFQSLGKQVSRLIFQKESCFSPCGSSSMGHITSDKEKMGTPFLCLLNRDTAALLCVSHLFTKGFKRGKKTARRECQQICLTIELRLDQDVCLQLE